MPKSKGSSGLGRAIQRRVEQQYVRDFPTHKKSDKTTPNSVVAHPQQLTQNDGSAHLQQQVEEIQYNTAPVLPPKFLQQSELNEADIKKNKMQSVLHQSSLGQFLQLAQMKQVDFQAKRGIKFSQFRDQMRDKRVVMHQKLNIEDERTPWYAADGHNPLLNLLHPIRPDWKQYPTKEAFIDAEAQAYLKWRRTLAELEQDNPNYSLTPYEKNIQVWRQLWLVQDRTQILIQIVDGRDPLFYWCEGLEGKNNGKRGIAVVGKSDLLNQQQRKAWSHWLNQRGVSHIFFSSLDTNLLTGIDHQDQPGNEAQTLPPPPMNTPEVLSIGKLKRLFEYLAVDKQYGILLNRRDTILKPQLDKQTDSQSKVTVNTQLLNDAKKQAQSQTTPQQQSKINQQPKKLPEFKHQSAEPSVSQPAEVSQPTQTSQPAQVSSKPIHITIGLVGFPNVGKSSLLNSLVGHKCTGVSAMPGKTKHFQTIKLTPILTLLDCPGLVYPRIGSSQAQMVLNGLFPIDRLEKTQMEIPMEIIAKRFSQAFFEKLYGLHWNANEIYDGKSLGLKYAQLKGLYTGNGLPNASVASRNILKDYAQANIVYVEKPPGFDKWQSQTDAQIKQAEKAKQQLGNKQPSDQLPVMSLAQQAVDSSFFGSNNTDPSQPSLYSLLSAIPSSQKPLEELDLIAPMMPKPARMYIKHALKRNQPLKMMMREVMAIIDGKPKKGIKIV